MGLHTGCDQQGCIWYWWTLCVSQIIILYTLNKACIQHLMTEASMEIDSRFVWHSWVYTGLSAKGFYGQNTTINAIPEGAADGVLQDLNLSTLKKTSLSALTYITEPDSNIIKIMESCHAIDLADVHQDLTRNFGGRSSGSHYTPRYSRPVTTTKTLYSTIPHVPIIIFIFELFHIVVSLVCTSTICDVQVLDRYLAFD